MAEQVIWEFVPKCWDHCGESQIENPDYKMETREEVHDGETVLITDHIGDFYLPYKLFATREAAEAWMEPIAKEQYKWDKEERYQMEDDEKERKKLEKKFIARGFELVKEEDRSYWRVPWKDNYDDEGVKYCEVRKRVLQGVEPKRPKVAVAVMIIRDNHVLMSERLKGAGKGKYGLPGGHLEMGETFEEACKREALEEADLEIYDVEQVMTVNVGIMENKEHYVTTFFKAKCLAGSQPKDCERHKHGPWIWFPMDNLPRGKKCLEDFDLLLKHMKA